MTLTSFAVELPIFNSKEKKKKESCSFKYDILN